MNDGKKEIQFDTWMEADRVKPWTIENRTNEQNKRTTDLLKKTTKRKKWQSVYLIVLHTCVTLAARSLTYQNCGYVLCVGVGKKRTLMRCLSDCYATFQDPSRQPYLQHDCEVSLRYQHSPHTTCHRWLCNDSVCVRNTAHLARLLAASTPQTVTHTYLARKHSVRRWSW